MSVEIIIAFIVGLVVGLLAAWFYGRQRLAEHQALVARQDRSLQERAAEIAQLQGRLSEREGQLEAFKSRALEVEAEAGQLDATSAEEAVVAAPVTESPVAATKPDDLKRIEGIGPKIADMLNAHGILTFAQLAATDVQRLQRILEEAGPRFQLADPESWPEQAKLAAAGDWTALASLQDGLKGGRRE